MKDYRISILCLILGFWNFMAFNIAGSHLLPDGTLQEPFFLIPIGFGFLFASLLSALYIRFILHRH